MCVCVEGEEVKEIATIIIVIISTEKISVNQLLECIDTCIINFGIV